MNFSFDALKLIRLTVLCAVLCAVSSGAPRALAQDDCDDPKPHVEATPSPVPPKDWSPGPGIGVVVDENGKQLLDEDDNPIFDGRITAPVDSTDPNGPTQAYVKSKGLLSCAVESATDMDKWTQDDGDPCTPDSGHEADIVTYSWSASGGSFSGPTDGTSAQWKAPASSGAFTITCTIDDQPTALKQDDPATTENEAETGSRDDSPVIRSCVVIVPHLSLSVGKPVVAIGAVDNTAHQTSFSVTSSGPDGQAVGGVEVDLPVIVSGGWGPHEIRTAKVEMFARSTGSDGKAGGVFTSGNRQETTFLQIKVNPFAYDESSAVSVVGIEQVWNQLSDEDTWSYDPYFDYDVASTITFNMAYERKSVWEPIPGHSLEPQVSSISGYEWNPDIGEDWDDDGLPDGEYELVDYSADDEDDSGFNYWKGLVTWGGVTDNGGSYSVDQTIWWDEDFETDYVYFWMWDNNSYGPNGAED